MSWFPGPEWWADLRRIAGILRDLVTLPFRRRQERALLECERENDRLADVIDLERKRKADRAAAAELRGEPPRTS